jgi:hypothetical protein
MLRHSLLISLHRSHNHFIASFNYEGTMIVIEEVKATFQYFEATIGFNHTRSCILNLATLRVPQVDLEHLVAPFMEDEIYGVVIDMRPDKAPMPGGFTSCFF